MQTSISVNHLQGAGTKSKIESSLELELIKKAFFVLRAISHPLRKKILHLLDKNGPLTVTEIYIKLRIEQSVASSHLSVLRSAGMVKTAREGKFILYSLNKERISDIALHIAGLIRYQQ